MGDEQAVLHGCRKQVLDIAGTLGAELAGRDGSVPASLEFTCKADRHIVVDVEIGHARLYRVLGQSGVDLSLMTVIVG